MSTNKVSVGNQTSSLKEKDYVAKTMKEKGWNDRFVYSKFPSYHIERDKNYTAMMDMKYYIRNSQEIENTQKQYLDKFNSSSNENIQILISLWDEIGITSNFREAFIKVNLGLDPFMQEELISKEIAYLKKVDESLMKLSNEISLREKVIGNLKTFSASLKSGSKINDSLMSEIVLNLKNLRILSINIVHHLTKVRDIMSYAMLCGKHENEKLISKYSFDKNYLIKMQYDLDFLKETPLKDFFNFSDEADPFLIALSEKDKKVVESEQSIERAGLKPLGDVKENKKFIIAISPEMVESIKQCQFVIIQDLVYYQLGVTRQYRQQNHLYPFIQHGNRLSRSKLKLNKTKIIKSKLEISSKSRASTGKLNDNNPMANSLTKTGVDIGANNNTKTMKNLNEFTLLNEKYHINAEQQSTLKRIHNEKEKNKRDEDLKKSYLGGTLKLQAKEIESNAKASKKPLKIAQASLPPKNKQDNNNIKASEENSKSNKSENKNQVLISQGVSDNHKNKQEQHDTTVNKQLETDIKKEEDHNQKAFNEQDNNDNYGDFDKKEEENENNKFDKGSTDIKEHQNELKEHAHLNNKSHREKQESTTKMEFNENISNNKAEHLEAEHIPQKQKEETNKNANEHQSHHYEINEGRNSQNSKNDLNHNKNQKKHDDEHNDESNNQHSHKHSNQHHIKNNNNNEEAIEKSILENHLDHQKQITTDGDSGKHFEKSHKETEVNIQIEKKPSMSKKSELIWDEAVIEDNIGKPSKKSKSSKQDKIRSKHSSKKKLQETNFDKAEFEDEKSLKNKSKNDIFKSNDDGDNIGDKEESVLANNKSQDAEIGIGYGITNHNNHFNNNEANNKEEQHSERTHPEMLKIKSQNFVDEVFEDHKVLRVTSQKFVTEVFNDAAESKQSGKIDRIHHKIDHKDNNNNSNNNNNNNNNNSNSNNNNYYYKTPIDNYNHGIINSENSQSHANDNQLKSNKHNDNNLGNETEIREINKNQHSSSNLHGNHQHYEANNTHNAHNTHNDALKANENAVHSSQLIDLTLESPMKNLKYAFYNSGLEELESIYKGILNKNHDDENITYYFKCSKNTIEHYFKTGINPKVILVSCNDTMTTEGVVIVSYDSEVSPLNLSISLYAQAFNQDYNAFNSSIEGLLGFLKANMKFDQLFFDLFYKRVNEDYAMETNLTKVLKSHGFKWFNVINLVDGERFVKFIFKQTGLEYPISSMNYIESSILSINIFHSFAFSLEPFDSNQSYSAKENEEIINRFPIIYMLKDLEKYGFHCYNEEMNSIDFKVLKHLSKNFIMNLNQTVDFEKEMESLARINEIVNDKEHSCNLEIKSSFRKVMTLPLRINDNEYLFNRIEDEEVKIIKYNGNGSLFFIIPSGDGVHSIIITKAQNSDLTKCENFMICKNFNNYQHDMTEINPSELSVKCPVFWIPCFKNQSKIFIEHPSALSDLVINNKDRKFRISAISEDSNFNFNFDVDYLNSVKFPVRDTDVILDDKFYMAVVHYSIVNKLNIPSIFTLVCEKKNWIPAKEI